MIPLCSNACQHTNLASFCTSCAEKACNRFACLSLKKCKQGLPASFTVWLSFHFSPKPKIPFLVVRSFFASKPHGNASARVTLATSSGRVCSRANRTRICNRNCLDLCKQGRVALRKENDHKRSLRASSPIWASGTSLARLASLAQIGELACRL